MLVPEEVVVEIRSKPEELVAIAEEVLEG